MVAAGSDGEGAAAAAGLCGVGVGEIEPSADQCSAEVQLHPVDVEQALGVTDHFERGPVRSFVLITLIVLLNLCCGHEIHRVAHTAAATGAHSHSQHLVGPLVSAEPRQLLHGGGCDQNPLTVLGGVRRACCRGLCSGVGFGHRRQ